MPITSFGARATRSPGGSSWPTWRTTPGPHGRCCVPTGSSRIRPSLEFTPLPGSGLFLIIVIFRHVVSNPSLFLRDDVVHDSNQSEFPFIIPLDLTVEDVTPSNDEVFNQVGNPFGRVVELLFSVPLDGAPVFVRCPLTP